MKNSGRGVSDEELAALEKWRQCKVDLALDTQSRLIRKSLIEKDNSARLIVRKVLETPSSIDGEVKKYLKKSGLSNTKKHEKIYVIWYNVVGQELANQTAPVAFNNGVLTVEVFSPALRQELENFYREDLIKSMRDALPKSIMLRSIRFKLGVRERE